jgi:two-component system, sensor histidine kinase and response regulator
MKHFLIIVIYLNFLVVYSLVAQENNLNELENKLKTASEDTTKVQILKQLAIKYLTSKPQWSKRYLDEGIKICQKLNLKKEEASLLSYTGEYYWRTSEYAKAVDFLTQSLRLATQTKDEVTLADSYRLLARVHSFSLNQYDLGLSYHRLALPIYHQIGDKKRLIALYNNIAWVYYMKNSQLQEALQLTNQAFALLKDIPDKQLLAWSYNSKGLIYSRLNKLDSALYFFDQSNKYALKVEDYTVIAYNQNLIGQILIQQTKINEAKQVFQQNIPKIQAIGMKALLSGAYKNLADIYEQQTNYDSAYNYQKKYIALRDSLSNWENTQKIVITEAKFTQDANKARVEFLETQRFYVVIIISILFIVLLIILTLILRYNRQTRQNNRLLQEKNEEIATQNEEIAQQNEELIQSQEEISTQRDLVAEKNKDLEELNATKDKLFAIIGHDLRSPLNSLKGLLELANNQHISPEEFRLLASKLSNGVESAHFTLNNLLEWANTQMQGLVTEPTNIDLQQIAQENINLLSSTATAKQIQLINQIQENSWAFADPHQISLVLRNLINNAIKFTPIHGQVKLDAYLIAQEWQIWVSDTGLGMDEDTQKKIFTKEAYFTTRGTIGEKGTGLGLLLCQEMIEKNQGKIWLESKPNEGTIFKFTLMSSSNSIAH